MQPSSALVATAIALSSVIYAIAASAQSQSCVDAEGTYYRYKANCHDDPGAPSCGDLAVAEENFKSECGGGNGAPAALPRPDPELNPNSVRPAKQSAPKQRQKTRSKGDSCWYMDEQSRPCVSSTRSWPEKGEFQDNYIIEFKNICNTSISVEATTTDGRKQQGSVLPGSTMQLNCTFNKSLGKGCKGFANWKPHCYNQ